MILTLYREDSEDSGHPVMTPSDDAGGDDTVPAHLVEEAVCLGHLVHLSAVFTQHLTLLGTRQELQQLERR